MFNNMMYDIQSETVKHIFRTKFGVQIVSQNPSGEIFDNAEATIMMDDINKKES